MEANSSDEAEPWVTGEFIRGSRSLGLFERMGLVCSELAGDAVGGGWRGC